MTNMLINKKVLNECDVKNNYFDNKLKQKGLYEFKRKGNYINGNSPLTLLHLTCNREFKIKPKYFFSNKQAECTHCKNEEKIRMKNKICDNKLQEQKIFDFERVGNYINELTDVRLRHKTCGREFNVIFSTFLKTKNKCPHCREEELIFKNNKNFDDRLKEKGLLEFERKSDAIKGDALVKILHKNCNREFAISPNIFFKNNGECPLCKKEIQDKLNLEFDKKLEEKGFFNIIRKSDYINENKKIKLFHISCNREFNITPISFFSASVECIHCKEDEDIRKKKNLAFDNKLKEKGLLDFERKSDYINDLVEIELLHKICGRVINVKPSYFFKQKDKCEYCREDKSRNDKNKFFDDKLEEFGLSDYERKSDYINTYTEIKLLHKTCGNEFTTIPKSFFKREKHRCDICYNNESITKKNQEFDNKLIELGLLEFESASNYINIDSDITILHKTCGREFTVNALSFFNSKHKCIHCYNDSMSNKNGLLFDKKLKDLGLNDFERVGVYKNSNTKLDILHKTCGRTISLTPRSFFEREHKCEHCYEDKLQQERNLKFDNKLKQKGLIDFIRKSDYINVNTKIKLFHILCNKEIEVTPFDFFRRKVKCKHCQKKNTRKYSLPKNKEFQDKINEITNNEFLLLSDYYNLNTNVDLKHVVCWKSFNMRAYNFLKAKNKCPHCAPIKKDYNKTTAQRKNEILKKLGNDYEIVSKGFSYYGYMTLKHKCCGKTFKIKTTSIAQIKTTSGPVMICPKCKKDNRKELFLDKLDRVFEGDIVYKGGYKDMSTPTKFYRKSCGHTFMDKPKNLLNRKSKICPICKDNHLN